jgi:hypothetical protein
MSEQETTTNSIAPPAPSSEEIRRQAIEEAQALNQRAIEQATAILLDKAVGRSSTKADALKRLAKAVNSAADSQIIDAMSRASEAKPPRLKLTPAPKPEAEVPEPKGTKKAKPPKPPKAAKPPKEPKVKKPKVKTGLKKEGPQEGGSFDRKKFELKFDPTVKTHGERLMNRGNTAKKPFSALARKIVTAWSDAVKAGGAKQMTGEELRKFVNSLKLETLNSPMVVFQDYFPYYSHNGFIVRVES